MDWTHYAPYFRKEEFDCKCGCGLNNINEALMERIFEMRKETGIGFTIGSRVTVQSSQRNVRWG